jgi:hypothetical protein
MLGAMRAECPYCRTSFELDGNDVQSSSRKCPRCRAGLLVSFDSESLEVALAHEPMHPRWSARALAWANGSTFAVASVECLGVTIVHRKGLDVTLGADLGSCEHHGWDRSGERLLVDLTPFPRRGPPEVRLAVWTPSRGEVMPLAVCELDLEPPMLSRSRSSRDAIGWHREGDHIVAVTSRIHSHASLTVWSIRERTVRTEVFPDIERGRAWLEPGGSRMLWEEQIDDRCRLVLLEIDPRARSLVPKLIGENVRSAPTDVCDVVWEPDGSLLVAYVQNENGAAFRQHIPYGLVRLDPKMRVRAECHPLPPELCPMKPAPCTIARAANGDIVFVTDRAYALEAHDFRARGALPTNVRGGEAFRFDPTGEVVAISGPSDIHLASLTSGARTSLRAALG